MLVGVCRMLVCLNRICTCIIMIVLIVRRVSLTADNAISNAIQVSKTSIKNFMTSTVIIPEKTRAAHVIATASATQIISEVASKTERVRQARKQAICEKVLHTRLWTESNAAGVDYSTELFFVDLVKQRKLLRPSQQSIFEKLWCFEADASGSDCLAKSVERILRKEINFVKVAAEEKASKLKYATDQHLGLEIMHLFVLDLLGRDTPAAKIFASKTSTEYSF
jgi:hypothetical protein